MFRRRWSFRRWLLAPVLDRVQRLHDALTTSTENIMDKIAEATARAEALATRSEKIQKEVRDSLKAARDEIQALKDQIANGQEPDTTALEAALSRAETAVGAVDDENPDAPAGDDGQPGEIGAEGKAP